MPADRTLLGSLLMIGFCLAAPLIDMFAKLGAATLPVGQITWARYLVQSAVLVPVALAFGLSLRLDRRTLRLNVVRAALSIGSTFTFVAAVRVMPLADALAIAFVEPFFLLWIGHAFLRERVGFRRLAAAMVGFAGTLLIVQPSFAAFGAVALLPLATALFFALYILSTRHQSKGVHPVALQATTALVAAVLAAPAMVLGTALDWPDLRVIAPSDHAWMWLVGIGLAASVSHLFLTYALRFASATVLAPLHYLELVMATVLGLAVFGDFPDGATWVGMAIIVGSGLYIVHRERLASRAAPVIVPTGSAVPPSAP